MFFPIGFGSRLQVFPAATTVLCALIIFVSVLFLPTANHVDSLRILKKTAKGDKAVEAFLLDVCLERMADAELCRPENFSARGKVRMPASQKRNLSEAMASLSKEREATELVSRTLDTPPQELDQDLQQLPSFAAYRDYTTTLRDFSREVMTASGFLNVQNQSVSTYLLSISAHGSILHLLGNILMIVLVGIWVEQAFGAVFTLLLFLTGALFGAFVELRMTDPSGLVGASAGANALLGAFFANFYRQDANFIFTVFPFYFKRLSIPFLWICPLVFLGTDLLVLTQAARTGNTAHWAHLSGFALGLIAAMGYRKIAGRDSQVLYPEEMVFLEDMRKSTAPSSLSKAFLNLMSWNSQNWQGLLMFFEKSKSFATLAVDLPTQSKLESVLQRAIEHFYRRHGLQKTIPLVASIPDSLHFSRCLSAVPVHSLLMLADTIGVQGNLQLSKKIYKSTLTLGANPNQRNLIQQAISAIDSHLDKQDVKGQSV